MPQEVPSTFPEPTDSRDIVSRYSFPGFPIFLKSAATELERPDAAGPVHKMTAFTEMANLCAQASSTNRRDAMVIMAKAMEFRDQLRVASLAADKMLDEVLEAVVDEEPEIQSRPTVAKDRRSHKPSGRSDS